MRFRRAREKSGGFRLFLRDLRRGRLTLFPLFDRLSLCGFRLPAQAKACRGAVPARI